MAENKSEKKIIVMNKSVYGLAKGKQIYNPRNKTSVNRNAEELRTELLIKIGKFAECGLKNYRIQ